MEWGQYTRRRGGMSLQEFLINCDTVEQATQTFEKFGIEKPPVHEILEALNGRKQTSIVSTMSSAPITCMYELKMDIIKNGILLIIQTRSNPDGLAKTIQMCLDTCKSPENFQIACFIDDDQVDLYEEVRVRFPQALWRQSPHEPGDWSNTLKAQLELIKSFDCLFVWRLSDDFYGLSQDWDAHILSTKDIFHDGIFTLHGSANRNPGLCSIAYDCSENLADAATPIWQFGECLPIWTKKWAKYVMPLAIDTGYSSQTELITAVLALLLRKYHNFTRIVGCGANYSLITESGNTSKFLDKSGQEKEQSFFKFFTSDSLKFFQSTVDEIANEITIAIEKEQRKMQSIVTEEQIEFFKENGYLLVSGIFTEEDADECNRLIRRHANNDFAAIVNPDRYEDLKSQDERPKSDVTLEELEQTSNYFLSVMKNSKLVASLEDLTEKEMVGLSSQFIFKEAHSRYANQAWAIHQDGWYPGDKDGNYITANWFLRNSDVENGTIFVYPGSHKLGLLPAQPQKSFREDYDKNPGSNCDLPSSFEGKKVDLIIPKSGVVFLHGHCVHGSYPNKSGRSRPWHSCCYIAKGSSYIVGENAKRKEICLR